MMSNLNGLDLLAGGEFHTEGAELSQRAQKYYKTLRTLCILCGLCVKFPCLRSKSNINLHKFTK